MPDVHKLSVEESLDIITRWPVVQFDTETTGLDPRVCRMTSMQFGYREFSTSKHTEIVVDCNSVDPVRYKDVLEQQVLIGHNLKFDLQFLYNFSITPLTVYDTMVSEQTLYIGYKPGRVSYKLADVLSRYTGEKLDKSFQKQIATKGLTKEGIVYAANDVVHLQDIRKSQILVAKSRNCLGALVVENRFVPAIAYLEWCGVHLDENKWKAKMDSDSAQLAKCKKQLNDYVVSHTKLNKQFVSTYYEASLFDDPNTTYEPYCTVDWASPSQCVPVFQALGFNTKTFDKKTHKEKDSVEEKLIANQKGVDDTFLEYYFAYKDAEKKVSTYGQGHLDQINPNTGRLHTIFNQIGTVTGRMSSGAGIKTKNNDLAKLKNMPKNSIGYCNLQNLPARGEAGKITRACFTAEPRNSFISCDFSAEESRVQADVWEEKSLLESFEKGIDTHNLYAKLCFPEELKDVDVKDVKKVRPDLRQAAKSAEFALGYGSDGSAIAASIGMSVEKAKAMVQGILKGMPGMAAFKKKTIKFLKENGYIVINNITGHRIYWPEWAEWKATNDMMGRDFWNDYRMYHQGTNDSVAQMVREHNSKSKDWFEKNVLNYPIQGGSAIVLKQAAADLFEWVVKNGYFNVLLFCVFVHDEIDCECPTEMSDMFAKQIQKIMERAAGMYYHKLPIPAEYSVSDHWVH
ncbi:MAG: hypothetical protein II661_01190 [Bacteroidales bacterium]|nr:hypothetical protein [Bacteroidales bacterium]